MVQFSSIQVPCVFSRTADSGILFDSHVSVKISAQQSLTSRWDIILVLSSSIVSCKDQTLATSRLGRGGLLALVFSLACKPTSLALPPPLWSPLPPVAYTGLPSRQAPSEGVMAQEVVQIRQVEINTVRSFTSLNRRPSVIVMHSHVHRDVCHGGRHLSWRFNLTRQNQTINFKLVSVVLLIGVGIKWNTWKSAHPSKFSDLP